MMVSTNRRRVSTTALFIGLSLFTFVNLVPLIWAGITSIKQPVDAFSVPPTLIFTPTFEYHVEVWRDRGFAGFLLNSLIVSFGTIALSVPAGALAAYGLSRMDTRVASPVLMALFSLRMFPHMLLAIPFFVMGSWLNMIDSYWLLILALVAINQPFTIWLMYGFLSDIPKELDESAALDGCNAWQTFTRVILPIARPGLAVAALFSLLLSYNEFLLAHLLTGNRTKTLPVVIASFGGEDISGLSLAAAGAIGIMAPIIAIMILQQRQLLSGMTMGALK